jgi:serine/threonine protein kinase
MENGSLTANRIRFLTPTEKMIIMNGSARGFEYLHSRHIIHRDINPFNILLDERHRPRICDLGMSITTEEDMDEIIRPTAYMSPVILDHQCGVWGYPADVYAFAISCYLIAGEKQWPLPGIRSFPQLKAAFLKGSRPDVRKISNTNFTELLNRMWSQNPTERLTFKEVADSLKEPKN